MLPGFENVLIGLKAGEIVTFSILPESAFRRSNPRGIFVLPAHQIEPCLIMITAIGNWFGFKFADINLNTGTYLVLTVNVYIDLINFLSDKSCYF